MSLTYVDFNNGESLLDVRTKLNDFNNNVVTEVNTLSTNVTVISDGLTTQQSTNNTQQLDIDGAKVEIAQLVADVDINTISTTNNSTQITAVGGRIDNVENGVEPVNLFNFTEQIEGTHLPTAGNFLFEDGVLEFYGKHPEAPLKIGRMLQTEAWNTSGATILKGTPVKYAGPYSGESSFAKAQSDTFSNASVMGLAAYDIPNLTKGVLITQGVIKDIDTSSFAVGMPTYLSQTVAGELTQISPDISSRVSLVLVSDGLIGQMYISINNILSLPVTLASTLGQANTYSMSANIPNPIIGYTRSLDVVLVPDIALGTILVQQAGIYDLVYEFSGTISDEEVDMTVELYDVTHDTVIESFIFTSGRAINPILVPMTHTFRRPFDVLADNTTFQIRMISKTLETLVINDASFTITSIHAR